VADVVEALEVGDQLEQFYDRAADELVWVFEDDLVAADAVAAGGDLDAALDRTESGEPGQMSLALRIIQAEPGVFVRLPSNWDVHMHSIMEDFVVTLPESGLSRRLWDVLHHTGAFRRFKDMVYRYDLEDAWNRYREDRLAEIARAWAEENDVPLAE